MSFESFPFIIGWELTLKCNLKCKHCASSAGRRRKGELTLKKSLDICDQFSDLLVKEVVFTGGEPLMNPNWDRIASHLSKNDIKSGMVTNGTLLTLDVISRMKDSGIDSIGISIDGTESIHDKIRGIKGLFRKTMNSIEFCINHGINVTIITLISGLNINELDEIRQIVESTGAWKWQLQPIFPLGRSRKNKFLFITEEQFLDLGIYIHNIRTRKLMRKVQVVPADSCGFCSVLDFPEFGWEGCGAGRFSCGIMSDGRIKGCLSWPDFTVEGDLNKDDLWDIWFREEAFSKLRSITTDDLNGDCSKCDFGIECGGGCQAMSLATTENWHSDPFCYHLILNKFNKGSLIVNH